MYESGDFSFINASDQKEFISFTFQFVDTVLLLTEHIITTMGPAVNKENANTLIAQMIGENEI